MRELVAWVVVAIAVLLMVIVITHAINDEKKLCGALLDRATTGTDTVEVVQFHALCADVVRGQ